MQQNRQIMIVANPIYDIVFKYLLEDERIARTLLSALLKKDVVAVVSRRNEYSNIGRNGLSVFRIDFGATIQESDGSRHLILIELQKTWLEGSKPRHCVSASISAHNMPMWKTCCQKMVGLTPYRW